MMMSQRYVAIYCRVVHDDEFALTRQRYRIRDFVSAHPGWLIESEFLDIGSGNPNLGSGINGLLLAAREHQFELVVVYSVSRLARDSQQIKRVIAELNACGVCVVTATGDGLPHVVTAQLYE